MTTIVTRAGAGVPLSNNQVDANFTNLNTDKLELGGTFSSGTANSLLFLNASKVASSGTSVGADVTFNGVTVGRGAGAVSTNTAVGASALAANTTGAFNTTVGTQALTTNTTGERNTVIGRQAMFLNTTGGYNVAVGMNAMEQNTTASNSVAVGYTALQLNTTGSNNVAVGYNALVNNTTASNNTAVGYQAGYSTNTGVDNVFVGQRAGYSNTSGYAITAVGRVSMHQNTTGIENSAFGEASLYTNTTGSYNTALGKQSLFFNTTASNNTAVGYQAGYSNTTGASNVFVGYQAGYGVTTSNGQTFIGVGAGAAKTTGGNNTFIGCSAGASATTGTGNTFIGVNDTTNGAGFAVTTGSKNTIIGGYTGNQGGLDIRTASNYIVLSDGDGNPRVFHNGGILYNYRGDLTNAEFICKQTTSEFGIQSNGQDGYLNMTGTGSFNVRMGSGFTTVLTAGGPGKTIALEGGSNTTGVGIAFPATQVASSNANTLDDYEEGTWTPTVGGNATMGIQAGDYIKIGKLVWINFDFSVVTLGTGSNKLITGLPFTFNGGQSARTAGSVNYFVNLASTASAYYLQVDGNGIYLDLNNAAAANITDGPVWIGDGTRIMGTIMYQTTA